MNERIVICPHDSLVKTVVDQLPNDIRDYSHIALVFPGKRPAHFIRKELAVNDWAVNTLLHSMNFFRLELNYSVNWKNFVSLTCRIDGLKKN